MADIELVIKIPEEKYKWIKENILRTNKNSIVKAIVHGTPLPKGHGDIIDRSKIEYMRAIHDLKWGEITASECAKRIKYSAPTIIEADKE